LIGAIVFMLAQDYIAGLNPAYWQFWIGLLLIVIVLFARGGILGGLGKIHARFTRRPVEGRSS
jgi:branched-chain amino acid transport system permease protein